MKHRLSAITLAALMGAMLWCTTVFYPRYDQPGSNATLAWDAAGYYWYLPAVFIYHDLSAQHWADSVIRQYNPGPENIAAGIGFKADNGHFVMKYPSGMALLESPFFFAAHALAKPLGYPADGFSRPYQLAVQLGALLFAFLGLWLLRRLLLFYYADGVTALCLFVLVIGSNYLNYSAIDGSVSHSWLFTLYVALMLCTRSFYIRPAAKSAVAIGALCGLATLVRPTDIIAVLIPMLWGLESIRMPVLRERLLFFRDHAGKIFMAVLAAGCIIAIQPVYWKIVADHWFVYSYQTQEFSWKHPHFRDYTFSYRSGWLMYTPAMLLAVIGFMPFLMRGRQRVVITVFSALAFYIVSAWDVWWYAGMGGRAMVQYYPALLFPMASLFTWLAAGRLRSIIAAPVVLLLVYINIWFTYQAHRGGLYDSDSGMTKAYYWRVIGRWRAPEEVQKLKDGQYLYEAPLPAAARTLYADPLRPSGDSGDQPMLMLDSAHQRSPYYTFAFHRQAGEKWLRAEATFQCVTKEWYVWAMTQFELSLRRHNEAIRQGSIRVQRFAEKGRPKRLWVDLELPDTTDGDSVSVHFWNAGSNESIIIKDLKVLTF